VKEYSIELMISASRNPFAYRRSLFLNRKSCGLYEGEEIEEDRVSENSEEMDPHIMAQEHEVVPITNLLKTIDLWAI
jgi:hypothetical protein